MAKEKEPKKDFEDKLKQRQSEEPQPEEEKKGWFGKMRDRIGKKRQRRTAEEIAQDRLAQAFTVDPKQVELFKPVLKIPFDVWADNIKIKELRLTESEAQSLALPVAQLINYYLPRLSPIGYVWLSFGLTGFGIMQIRLKLLADVRKQKKKEQPEAKVE